MNCSNCGFEEVSSAAKFCSRCGAALEDASGWSDTESTEAGDLQGVVAGLQTQINRPQSQVNRQTQRIYALENAAPVTPPSQIPGRAAVPVGAPVGSARAPAAQQGTPTSAPPHGERADLIAGDWEWLLGGNWLARVGILAMIIGVGFFLKLAFDNDWIGETGQVVLGRDPAGCASGTSGMA